MSGIDEQLERAQADGKISAHDADEVRKFALFLDAAPPPKNRDTPAAKRQFRKAYREHYPEHFYTDVAPFWGADPWGLAGNA